jgi:inner membrane transporter RhtA
MNIALEKTSPTVLVILSIICIQVGSALSKSLFSELGPWGVVLLRMGFSALILSAFTRPTWKPTIRSNFRLIFAFGAVFALANAFLFTAIDRIPLGIAISIQFTGPLGLAAIKSQRWLDGLWVTIAGFGILLLTPLGGASVDILGIGLALLAGLFWALYIVLAAKVAENLPSMEGLTWAFLISTVLLLPVGIATAGSRLLDPQLLVVGAGVAVLSTTLPFSLEMVALRSIPVKIFGVILSLEPMISAIAGLIILKEPLSTRSIIACLLVSIAAAGAAKCRIPRIEPARQKGA